MPGYKRIVLKISGAALGGSKGGGIDPDVLSRLAHEIGGVVKSGVQVGIVVGAGNFYRGAALAALGIDRITGDQVGMVATVMNALVMRDALENLGFPSIIMSAIPLEGIVSAYNHHHAIHDLNQGKILLMAAGTGNPLVTTDTAASLRAIEVKADILLKATGVDGVFDKDPKNNSDAMLYDNLSYHEVLEKELGVMDLAAFCQCRDHKLPVRVFNINKSGALQRVIMGEQEGTLVS